MQNRFSSTTGAGIAGLVIILLVVGCFILRNQANSAASTYTKALKQHAISYDTKITQIGNQATDTTTIAGGRAVLQAYQPVVKEFDTKQPKLASVPLGSVFSGSYKNASKLHDDFSRESKNIYSLGVAADQYFGTFDALNEHLRKFVGIEAGIGLERTTLGNLEEQAGQQADGGGADGRKRIADERRQGMKDYAQTFKQLVKTIPLPNRYAYERNNMYAAADRFVKYHEDYADAFEKGDITTLNQLKKAARKADGTANEKYDMVLAATKPFSDPDKLKDPYGLYAKHFNALIAKVKNS